MVVAFQELRDLVLEMTSVRGILVAGRGGEKRMKKWREIKDE